MRHVFSISCFARLRDIRDVSDDLHTSWSASKSSRNDVHVIPEMRVSTLERGNERHCMLRQLQEKHNTRVINFI